MTDKAKSTPFLVTATEGVRQTAPHLSTARTEAPTLTAGRELDALVAEKVMELAGVSYYRRVSISTAEWEKCGQYDAQPFGAPVDFYYQPDPTISPISLYSVPRYSTDIGAAWAILERLEPYHFDLGLRNDGWLCNLCVGNDNSHYFEAYGGRRGEGRYSPRSAAFAICKAALKAVSVLSQTEEGK